MSWVSELFACWVDGRLMGTVPQDQAFDDYVATRTGFRLPPDDDVDEE